MSTSITDRPASGAPRLGGLVRAEFLRARSRRSLRWLALLALLAVVGVAAIMWATTGTVGQAEIDRAADQFIAEQTQWYDECMADPVMSEADKELNCYQPTHEDALLNSQWTLDKQPFTDDSLLGLLYFAGGIGLAACLMIAASAGGAEWSARTMGLLFSWEPRRLRVFAVRLGVVVFLAVLIEAVLVGVGLGLGSWIAGQHSLEPGAAFMDTSGNSWTQVDLSAGAQIALRWLPLAGLAAAGGFGVAMATRSTGWAIGAALVFVLVAESLVQALWTWGSQWLIQTNAGAWLQGGMTWTVRRMPETYTGSSGLSDEPTLLPGQVFISAWRALGVLGAIVLVILLVAGVLLRRRDVD